LQTLGDGLYIADPKGGQTAGGEFSFGRNTGTSCATGGCGKGQVNIRSGMGAPSILIGIGSRVELAEMGNFPG